MMPPVLHFGYFDHTALTVGKLCDSLEGVADRLASTLHDLFGPLPGRAMPGLGFFNFYGVLSCECPSRYGTVRLPVDCIGELVDRSGCDVVYGYNGEFHLISRAELANFLDPKRIPLTELGTTEQSGAPDSEGRT